ncbi:hypothetical protein SAMN04487968_11066 [Nocardioides terrae]|uniref:DUF5709 domain-containing protein n=1 Tax=Nocardioides terrae TaxID=574651 RepID=A0A1I1LHZ5_9ACTN|nr:DUF5709 domain-containing protein [Nocardioides terrae]SFC72641.1 hypothetical protein SAMN04487968_11066 [Nocardioides terrae]
MTEERESYGDYSVDDEDQPGAEPDGTEDLKDELDRGYSPPERYSPDYGNTPWEEAHGETLDQRVRQEVPEEDPYTEDGWTDEEDGDGEVGDVRAGRLVDPDQGGGEDSEKDMVGQDVGIDGAAASAEEAAMHVVPDEEWDNR